MTAIILDPGPLSGLDLPNSAHPNVRFELAATLAERDGCSGSAARTIAASAAVDPAHPILRAARFRRIRIPLADLAGAYTTDLELYLSDGDRAGYETVRALEARYRAALPVDLILLVADPTFGWQVIDGCHRLSAADHAGRTEIEAYELL